jgi:ubiquinone/menaquinone biosynthesis C-methylase UbiE
MVKPMHSDKQIATNTGALYASIWDQFDRSQWEQFSDDHFRKWSPLPVDNDFFQGKQVLDAGCGSGRAVRSMLLSGAAKVCAIDVGEGCIRNTTERNADFADRLDARVATVLDIPFPDATFDVVHCDGVLMITTDPQKGFSELVRVLKPGGTLIIAVYGKGGLMNFAIYSARFFRHIIPQRFTFWACKRLSKNPVIWYAIMDCMYVPIRKNYYASEIHGWLTAAGLTDIVRLDSSWGPYGMGTWMKGEGYIKFIAKNPIKG